MISHDTTLIRMNKEQADALCTIITLGFLADKNTRHIPCIYDDDADRGIHDELMQILNPYNITINPSLQNAKDRTTGRKILPFIYALPEEDARNQDYILAIQLESENILDIAQLMETSADSIVDPNHRDDFRGAYIGGFIDFEQKQLSLLGPSSLYTRPYQYINPDGTDWSIIYDSYAHVTTALKDLLINSSETLSSDENIDGAYSKIIVSADVTTQLIQTGAPEDRAHLTAKSRTIASCHGLVTSIYHHAHNPQPGVCIEFSLSNGTCKSASCIPCAIFASSQKTPASQFHFGRGDFWNLPEPSIRERLDANIEATWRAYVIKCCEKGLNEILKVEKTPPATQEKVKKIPPATREMSEIIGTVLQNDSSIIPDLFLDALTFEGSFSRKIKNSLVVHP